MRFNFKNKVFKPTDFLVETHMRLVVTGRETLEQVPNYGNLREVVKAEVDRINREWEEIERTRKEALERIQKEREERVE